MKWLKYWKARTYIDLGGEEAFLFDYLLFAVTQDLYPCPYQLLKMQKKSMVKSVNCRMQKAINSYKDGTNYFEKRMAWRACSRYIARQNVEHSW